MVSFCSKKSVKRQQKEEVGEAGGAASPSIHRSNSRWNCFGRKRSKTKYAIFQWLNSSRRRVPHQLTTIEEMPSEESSRWFRVGHSKYVKENEIPTPKAEPPVSPGDEEYKESPISPTPMDLSDLREVEKSSENAQFVVNHEVRELFSDYIEKVTQENEQKTQIERPKPFVFYPGVYLKSINNNTTNEDDVKAPIDNKEETTSTFETSEDFRAPQPVNSTQIQKFLEEYSESTQTPENTAPIVEIERPGCNIFSGAPFDANKYVPGLSAATDQFIREIDSILPPDGNTLDTDTEDVDFGYTSSRPAPLNTSDYRYSSVFSPRNAPDSQSSEEDLMLSRINTHISPDYA